TTRPSSITLARESNSSACRPLNMSFRCCWESGATCSKKSSPRDIPSAFTFLLAKPGCLTSCGGSPSGRQTCFSSCAACSPKAKPEKLAQWNVVRFLNGGMTHNPDGTVTSPVAYTQRRSSPNGVLTIITPGGWFMSSAMNLMNLRKLAVVALGGILIVAPLYAHQASEQTKSDQAKPEQAPPS